MKSHLFLAALALSAAPAFAATWTTPAPAGSGCTSYDVSDIINRIDTNQDGKMTHEEWTAAGAPESSYKMMDPHNIGYTTPEIFTKVAPPAGIDANHDCKITLDEMKAMEKRMPAGGKPPAQ